MSLEDAIIERYQRSELWFVILEHAASFCTTPVYSQPQAVAHMDWLNIINHVSHYKCEHLH